MTAKFFVDTNILLYAVSNAMADQKKRQTARSVLTQPDIGFSAQVLQEFYSAAISKAHLCMSHDEAIAVIESLADFPVQPITRELVLEAVDTKRQFGISYWDAAIVTAARRLSCHTLYSEDLNDGQDYGGVKVVNPFAKMSPS